MELSSIEAKARSLLREIHIPTPEEDGRRHYNGEEDQAFIARYRELNGNMSALARELAVSRQTVTKRLDRIARDRSRSATAFLLAFELLGQRSNDGKFAPYR
jgi:transposase-like protein